MSPDDETKPRKNIKYYRCSKEGHIARSCKDVDEENDEDKSSGRQSGSSGNSPKGTGKNGAKSSKNTGAIAEAKEPADSEDFEQVVIAIDADVYPVDIAFDDDYGY